MKRQDNLPEQNPVIERLRRLVAPFEERQHRASVRLKEDPETAWHFGLVGLNTEVEEYDLWNSLAILKTVEDAPGEIELAGALRESHLFGSLGRYSSAITHEIRILPDLENEIAFSLAWSIVALLRTRTLAEFLAPAACNRSWSTIAAIKDRSCEVVVIEDYSFARQLAKPVTIDKSDFDWVSSHLEAFMKLRSEPRFQLAAEALSGHQHQTSDRMIAALIWSGIEALFGINAELRFRLASMIAALLEPRGEDRRSLYRRVKKLYDIRSQIVHGEEVVDEVVTTHIVDVRALLSRLLCSFIESGRVPDEADLENALFS